jgi:hypothetical protein
LDWPVLDLPVIAERVENRVGGRGRETAGSPSARRVITAGSMAQKIDYWLLGLDSNQGPFD